MILYSGTIIEGVLVSVYQFYQRWRVSREGKTVQAYLVQANSKLYHNGVEDLPASVILKADSKKIHGS